MVIGASDAVPGPGHLDRLATDVDGRIYVVDQFFRKVEVFREATVPEDWPIGKRKTVAMPAPAAS